MMGPFGGRRAGRAKLMLLALAPMVVLAAWNQTGEAASAEQRPAFEPAAAVVAQLDNAQIERWIAEGWLTDFTRVGIDLGEILDDVGRDRIPPINDPAFVSAEAQVDLPDREPVIALVINGDARAYPLRIMLWHEIVNDLVGGLPVMVTYCPLCNSAVVMSRTVDGQVLDFGNTGKLRFFDMVMYDLQTETWWQQFSARALVGALAETKLELIPSRLMSWGEFRADYPNGQVLVPNDEGMRPYWMNPYLGYDTSLAPRFDGQLPTGMRAMERVVLIRTDPPIALTLALIEQEGVIEENGVIIRWKPGQASALDAGRIEDGRDVGGVEIVRIENGAEIPVVHDVTFAFAVSIFEPFTPIRTE